jgi:Recombination endonuclease VII
MERKCYSCKEVKPIEMFSKDRTKTQGYGYRCNDCDYTRPKQHHRNTPRTAYHRKYRNSPKAKAAERNRKLRDSYGITQSDYDDMWIAQGGLCAICRLTSKKSLAVDHCHTTGKVRGLLCQNCNIGIGNLKDSVIILESATRYIKAHLS